MGKIDGFLEIQRQTNTTVAPKERIKNFNDFHIPLEKQERCQQGARCMDCGVPYCQFGMNIQGGNVGCPLYNLIPEWNDLIYHNNDREALQRLLKTNNFPEFTGRVCPALCEASCICGLNDDPVTIKENELGIIETAFENGWMDDVYEIPRNEKSIAIIGSGPAGLTVADQLNKRGYQVTVFERADRIGGLLMYGIPNMKLEKNIIDRRVELMKKQGVHFKVEAGIESKRDAEKILTEHDRVVLACGARKARRLEVEGIDSKGIYPALEYLTKATKQILDDEKMIPTKDKNVVVVGGGDTGNDCVATAIRFGCKSVIQLEMMPELPTLRAKNNPWPLWPKIKKTDYGQEECIAILGYDPRQYQTTIKRCISSKGQVKQLELISLEPKEIDGRVQMVPIEGSEKFVDADVVLIAAGFVGCEEHVANCFAVECDQRGNVASQDYHTSNEKVLVAGDMNRGQSLVVWAIREGREVAKIIDEELMGYSNL